MEGHIRVSRQKALMYDCDGGMQRGYSVEILLPPHCLGEPDELKRLFELAAESFLCGVREDGSIPGSRFNQELEV